MGMSLVRRTGLLAGACLTLLLMDGAAAYADEAANREAEQAIAQQDKALRDAARSGTTGRIVSRYMSQLSRQESPLSVYLVGRALYYDRKPVEALRYMQRTLQLDAEFWNAERGLTLLYLEDQKFDLARFHLDRVRTRRPDDLDLLALSAKLHFVQEEWALAQQAVEQILAREPQSMDVRLMLVEIHSRTGNLDGAANELAILTQSLPDNLRIRMAYAGALAEQEKYSEAAEQFERVLRLEPGAVHVLKTLGFCYAKLENRKGYERTLRRMLETAETPAEREQIEEGLRRLEAGPAEAGAGSYQKDPFMELVERCLHPTDAEVRYQALVTYYEEQVPMVPLVIYQRLDPEREPDPRCRWMLLRILGQLESSASLPRIAAALWDPDMRVRRVAADELGAARAKAALVYLEPYFLRLPIDPAPTSPEARAALESEYNAAREAIRQVTTYRDVPVGETTVTVEAMPENRRRWETYLSSELGRQDRLDAIAEFAKLGDPYPENYLLFRVMAEQDVIVVRAAYDVLLAYHDDAVTGADPEMKSLWEGFPRYDATTITSENLGTLRDRMRTFFSERRERLRAVAGGR